MTKRKTKAKEIEIRKDEKEEIKVPTMSEKQKARKKLLLAYKEQNPVKFAHKGFAEELKNL